MKRFHFKAWRTMATSLTIVAGLVAGASVGLTHAEDKPKPEDSSFWMKKKVEYSHQVFDGLATGDFEQISEGARHMRALGRVETFARGRTPGYRRNLENFQEASEEILRQSEAKNLEGVTLAFTQMTYSCVACHKELRK